MSLKECQLVMIILSEPKSRFKRLYGPREHWWDANMKLAYDIISEENADVDLYLKTNMLRMIYNNILLLQTGRGRGSPPSEQKKKLFYKKKLENKIEKKNEKNKFILSEPLKKKLSLLLEN